MELDISQGKRGYQLFHNKIQTGGNKTLRSVLAKNAVKLPQGSDLNEWLLIHGWFNFCSFFGCYLSSFQLCISLMT